MAYYLKTVTLFIVIKGSYRIKDNKKVGEII